MLTFIIPVGHYHRAIAERAVSSVLAQTLRCSVVVVYDHDRHGTGWARNAGLAQVTTPFVTFLDADDEIALTFAEACLRAYDGRHYVYTDWLTDRTIEAPCRPWDGKGASHIVTTLLPTAWVRHVGGFDESLVGGEDTDFYWKLTRAGLCGRRLPEPLVQYHKGGLRAHAFVHGAQYSPIMQAIVQRYKDKTMPCGDCGAGNIDTPNFPANQPQDGDVLAQSLWLGNRQERGRMTGRLYPRSSNGKQLWMSPADIDAAPHLFARVVEMPPALDEAAIAEFQRATAQALDVIPGTYAADTVPPTPAAKPDVGRVLRLYNPDMSLTQGEVNALRHGDKLEVSTEGVKVNAHLAPDHMSREWSDGIPR